MIKEKEIKVITIGQITREAKINYSKAMARALMEQYGKEACQEILASLIATNI